MSPLIQPALSVRALNASAGLNLFKRSSSPALTPMTFAFLDTCPEASSRKREASIWKTSIVLAAEHSGSLGSVLGIGPDELRCGRQVAGTVEWEEES